MNTELARDLQYRITKEALAMLVIHGSAAETKDYERAIILIGSAWGLDPQNAVSHLELITREKEAARGTAEPEETRHVLPESELPMNASGMETLDNVCGLFETAIQLESRDHGRPSSGRLRTDGNAEPAGLDREDAGGTGAA